MLQDPYLTGIVQILGLMAIISLVETFIPLVPRSALNRTHIGANLGLAAITFGLNFLMNGVLMMGALWVRSHDAGLIQWAGLSMPAAVILTIIVMDLGTYTAHVLMHKSPLLWRAHLVHHCDQALDVTTSFRQHPIESVWRFVFLVMTACGLGAPVAGILLYRTLSAVNAVLEHANISVHRKLDAAISWIWCSPNMHKLHHSQVKAQTDSNYGNLFSLFDRLFCTFTPSVRVGEVRYGIIGYDAPQTQKLLGLIMLPFGKDRQKPDQAISEMTA